MGEPIPALRLHAVSFRYPDGQPALANLSLRIDPGEEVGLVGPNGAGKTTLFLCIAGVLPLSSGQISVFDLNPEVPSERKLLPRRLGLLFQDPEDQLFCPTVADDVAFGPLNLGLPLEEARQRVERALATVGLEGLGERVPHRLSGGEKRRVALAGVLAMQPDLLLLDEPTAFLDPRGRRDLVELLRNLPQTKLIASHDLAFVRATCHRVLLLDGGKLLADGPTAEVFKDHNLLREHGLEEE